ncbi:glycosyltransferase involved in cell wall biosynthesis [Salinibacter ruber]|nr:glycosyltransferase involved in cell wall biosynthesis [Salinibacter ruber]
MRILLASASSPNPFIGELANALSIRPEVDSVEQDLHRFWKNPKSADVVHIHWPRALFPGWDPENRDDLERLEQVLDAWDDQIVINTVHNLHAHYRDSEIYEELNRMVYDHVDGFVHMGQVSEGLFQNEYPETKRNPHEVIPHGRYEVFDNGVSREEARRRLGLGQKSHVVLAFGALRHPEELRLLMEGLRIFSEPKKKLVVAGRLAWANNKVHTGALRGYHSLRSIARPVQFYFGAIDNDEVQYFLNACDQIVIPRKDILNSGDVTLGFTFGRVVVGPKCGVVQEVLEETGNPVYDPESPESLANALNEGVGLVKRGKGEQNRVYAEKFMDWGDIARKHIEFYKSVR